MKKTLLVSLLPLTFLAAPVLAQDMDMQAAMEKWVQMATPGAPHQHLADFAGTWDAKVKMWMDPAAPPEESTGTSVNTMELDGRWLQQRYTGSMMGQPFHGIGYTGYDNYKQQYVSTWMDTASTSVMLMTGTMDASGVMTCTGSMDDCITGGVTQMKETVTVVDKDHHKMEMWASGPDGQMYKNMEIEYIRKKM